MHPTEAMGMKAAFFSADLENEKIGVCIIKGEGY